MYRILIVDDEKKEREGIALLIRKFKLPLDVTLACNGEEALEIISRSRYDILLTDIKMPYMDGIQLITEVQKKGLSPICIIYSAYGEFEYARNAISLGVLEYLLKPIQFEAFLDLFNKVIGLCRQKEENEQKKIEIQQIKEEVAAHKIGWDFLNFLEGEENELSFQNVKEKLKKELPDFMDMQKDVFIPILISSYSNLFALEWEKYRKAIEEQFGENTIIINTADNQIVVLVIEDMGAYRQAVGKTKCMSFIELSQTNYQADIFVVLGKVCTGIEELKKEYTELKDQLDYQFFVSKSQLLVHDESYFFKKENDMLQLYFERIINCAKMLDYSGMKKEFVKVFYYISKESGFSSIYVKYTFTDAIKRINELTKTDTDLVSYIERIYQAKNIEEVSGIVMDSLEDMERNGKAEQKENRLVRMAKNIVYEQYGENNLNVSYIADSLNVSSAYLSSLYKIETGQNLVKFITQYRIEKSKELLRQTNMKVNDIAQKVGYLNVSYYTSIFRNHEGCSPLQYREGQDHE